jgi:CubicO group peptidase (beta-lactamase class C family)
MTKNQLPGEAYPINLGGKRDGVGFGLGFSVVVQKTDYSRRSRVGEYGWGGAASTHFWISPQDDLAVVVLTQLMPFNFQMEHAVKPLVYDAVLDPGRNHE